MLFLFVCVLCVWFLKVVLFRYNNFSDLFGPGEMYPTSLLLVSTEGTIDNLFFFELTAKIVAAIAEATNTSKSDWGGAVYSSTLPVNGYYNLYKACVLENNHAPLCKAILFADNTLTNLNRT